MALDDVHAAFSIYFPSLVSNDDASECLHDPLIDREPTPLETFSRTIRNYVPSSIPIPSAAPSPPRVSRPVSFGSFLSPATHTLSPPTRARDGDGDWKRRGSDASSQADLDRWPAQQRRSDSGSAGEMPVFSLDDVPEDGPREGDGYVTRYPGVGDAEQVVWAGWDTLANVSDGSDRPKTRAVLMLGYPRGLQVWDCSNLGSVSELLNLTGAHWGAVEFAGVLPDPPSLADDAFRVQRPLVGFSSRTAQGTDFIVYSLRTHEVVKRLPLIGFTSFAAASQFIIVCTSNPSTLHIISSCTLATLYTIPQSSLVSFTPPPIISSSTKPNIHDVSPLDIDSHYSSSSIRSSAHPHPIHALSNRLLAYVSPISRHDGAPAATPGQAHTSLPVAAAAADTSTSKYGLGMTQADLGNAAVKIGGSVLSGMKTLGGMAFSAARAGVTAAVSGEHAHSPAHTRSTSASASASAAGALGLFFSKSAPAATHEYQTSPDRRRRSLRVTSPVEGFDSQATVTPYALPPPPTSPLSLTSGCSITVVDLNPLLVPSSAPLEPEPIARFALSRPQALSAIKFSTDGTTLAVCSKDGHAVRVFQIRPTPRTLRQPPPEPPSHDGHGQPHPPARPKAGKDKDRDKARVAASPTEVRRQPSLEPAEHLAQSMQHVYTLRRGHTSAVVDAMEWAHDKLWFGMATRKRTIHVFALNPLGGRPDGNSHLAGKVVNPTELKSSSTELSPLVRVRLKPLAQDAANVPCAFTFLRSSEAALPPSLLPPASVHFSASSSPSSVSSSGLSKPVSPAQRPTRPTNYKDLLVFDPADGALTLRRIFVERPAPDQAVIPGSIPIAGGMSISLPGMSTLSRMGASASPPSSGASPRPASGLTQMMERATDVVGRESVVGTWALARGRDWPEVRQSLRVWQAGRLRAERVAKAESVFSPPSSIDDDLFTDRRLLPRTRTHSWLARAELSTFSTRPRILPRLIYLSHQFAFHALGEDYHALIRSLDLDVPSSALVVRTPIAVSAFATSPGDADAFVQGHDHANAIGPASSFDEPLASALAAQLHPLAPSPPVLPMLPNGTPGSASKGLLGGAIPIRQVAAGIQDGMSEGLGRIRRELGKARSPRLGASRDSDVGVVGAGAASVPLEFDEEDEDFMVGDARPLTRAQDAFAEAEVVSRSASTGADTTSAVSTSASVSTPSTTFNMAALPEEHGLFLQGPGDGGEGGEGGEEGAWTGWGPEEQQAVEDAERFDDITVGFLDEEHESMRRAQEREREAGSEKRKKKARSRKQH
ncbi:hypothetical protein C8Q80DRAFT_1269094 [Daedaleopsis nitida]|nr:hypothetical protein C8Q80DRAFT_1269094 [Daedaleopsis nitida]